jgi:hypothetical protein
MVKIRKCWRSSAAAADSEAPLQVAGVLSSTAAVLLLSRAAAVAPGGSPPQGPGILSRRGRFRSPESWAAGSARQGGPGPPARQARVTLGRVGL